MRIGIIGAGNIGGALTRRLRELGHDVAVSNSRAPETLADLAAETGARAVSSAEAANDALVVIITIPEKNISQLPVGVLSGAAPGAVFVDTGNYYPQQRDGLIAEIEADGTESGWVSQQLGVPVVKAFNGIYAQHLLEKGAARGAANRIALPVAGDDEAAKKVVMDLIDELGFEPVDAGTLAESWRQQPGTPVYGADFDADGVRRALAEASRERSSEWRA